MLYENTTNQGIILIIISMMIKLAVAPFHMWAPDVYDGSPRIFWNRSKKGVRRSLWKWIAFYRVSLLDGFP
jgi:hypothetical protein